MVIKKTDQKIGIGIEIDDIFKYRIEIDRKFLGAYRPITNGTLHDFTDTATAHWQLQT